MGLFKLYGASAEPVVLGRRHGLARMPMYSMPKRIATEYAAAGDAAGAPFIREHDNEVRVLRRETEHDDASGDKRGLNVPRTRSLCPAPRSHVRRLRCLCRWRSRRRGPIRCGLNKTTNCELCVVICSRGPLDTYRSVCSQTPEAANHAQSATLSIGALPWHDSLLNIMLRSQGYENLSRYM